MTKLEIETLAQNTHLCFAYSRDNATFNQEQRTKWLSKGLDQRARLTELITKELSKSAEPTVIDANKRLKTISQTLQNEEESLKQYADTVQEITDVVAILDTIIGLVTPV